MSAGESDSYRVERIAASSILRRAERGNGFAHSPGSANSQNRQRHSQFPPNDSEPPDFDEETPQEVPDADEETPQDVVEWSDAWKREADAAAPRHSSPALPSSDSEKHPLDLAV